MRACRPGPFKKWSVLLRITAYYHVLNGAYYRLAPPGPPDFPENLGVPPGGPRAYYDTSILERESSSSKSKLPCQIYYLTREANQNLLW